MKIIYGFSTDGWEAEFNSSWLEKVRGIFVHGMRNLPSWPCVQCGILIKGLDRKLWKTHKEEYPASFDFSKMVINPYFTYWRKTHDANEVIGQQEISYSHPCELVDQFFFPSEFDDSDTRPVRWSDIEKELSLCETCHNHLVKIMPKREQFSVDAINAWEKKVNYKRNLTVQDLRVPGKRKQ